MGMEVPESRLSNQSVEVGGEEISSFKENGGLHEQIKFGSHGPDEPVKDLNTVSEVKFPKDAVDEWPEPKQIHSFWFVKYRSFEDQKLRAKFEQLDKELQKNHQSRSQLIEKLREKKGERAKIISELKALVEENKLYWSKIDEKRKEIEPLQHALGQLRGAGYGDRGLCASVEELNDVIKSFQYRIQHESISLSEEKQILREIKQLESTREKVVANAAIRAKIQESMGEKGVLQDQVKLIGVGLDDVRKNQKLVKAKLNQLDEIKEGIDNVIRSLEEKLTEATLKRDKTFENIQELRKQREEGNLPFYENRSLLIKAKELAAKKDVEGLRDLSEREDTKFFSLWSSNKAFREDYEKRILPSLDSRQLTRDGRIRNPAEKPILSVEPSTPAEAEVVLVAKGSVKQPKENSSSSLAQAEPSLVEKEKNDDKKETSKKSIDVEDGDDYYVPEKVQKDPPKVNEVDEQKLKEMRREEEIAKAKQALERKKKIAEKAAAKAAIKAQKEAEKKEKEREKRQKKKAGASLEPEEQQTEASAELVSEPQKVEEVLETPVPENTDSKNATRYRKQRPKGVNSLAKTLIKRKKVTNYLMYASVAGAVVAVLLLAILGYQYLM